jgi:adenosylhomocysteine nucleosidase
MIAILVAVRQELKPILRSLRSARIVRVEHLDFHEGTLAGLPVVLLALGVGNECARIAAETTFRTYRPDLIISTGFGGGLSPNLNTGDIVIGNEVLEVLEEHGDDYFCRSIQANPRLPQIQIEPARTSIHQGRIVTTSEMMLKASFKKLLGQRTGALTVDMETSAVAAVAVRHQTPFLAIRCISDTVDETLPAEVNDFFVVGQIQPGRIFRACLRRPRLIVDLARLGRRASVAGRNLGRFMELALPQIPLPALTARRVA